MRHLAQRVIGYVLCGVALTACFAWGASAQPVRRDIDYRVIPQPQRVAGGARIEVIDFFFYACPVCNELAPHLDRWSKQNLPDVYFRHIPVIRHDSWIPLAKIFFALEAMGEAERLHLAVYRGYHMENLLLAQERVIGEWVAKNGLDVEKFMTIYHSDDVRRKVESARRMTRDYDIQGIPSVVIDGKFLTSTSMTPGVAQVIPIVDDLVRLVRQQRLEKN
jgi:thiol:disulfide interchange protein DsbA